MTSTPSGVVVRAAAALALLALTAFAAARELSVVPVSAEEDHFQLGEHLYATGTLSLDETPTFFRPPGFPAFVALVLHVRDAVSPTVDGKRAVALAHGGLLAVGALVVFLHTARRQPVTVAFAAGALYGFHPLSLLIARNVTYYTLHIVLVTVATLALSSALESQGRRRLSWAVAAGVWWGAATLVRPVSLLLPPFILLLAQWHGGRGSWRPALRFTALFTVAMAVVIAPYTLRNYRLSQRLVVVNAQDGFNFWGLTASRNRGTETSEWIAIWNEDGARIFALATGGAPYTTEAFYAHILPLNDAFRAEALRNVRRHPRRVAANVLHNAYAFNLDHSHRWLSRLGAPREGPGRQVRMRVAQAYSAAILLLALAGVVRGLREGDAHARTVAAVYLMFWAAHCLTILMTRYTYVRFPLVLVAFPLALRGIERRPLAVRAVVAFMVGAALAWELAIP